MRIGTPICPLLYGFAPEQSVTAVTCGFDFSTWRDDFLLVRGDECLVAASGAIRMICNDVLVTLYLRWAVLQLNTLQPIAADKLDLSISRTF